MDYFVCVVPSSVLGAGTKGVVNYCLQFILDNGIGEEFCKH
jgi:hypothetical protein